MLAGSPKNSIRLGLVTSLTLDRGYDETGPFRKSVLVTWLTPGAGRRSVGPPGLRIRRSVGPPGLRIGAGGIPVAHRARRVACPAERDRDGETEQSDRDEDECQH